MLNAKRLTRRQVIGFRLQKFSPKGLTVSKLLHSRRSEAKEPQTINHKPQTQKPGFGSAVKWPDKLCVSEVLP